MIDTRPRVALNGKTVDLGRLATEVGAPLCASDTEIVVADSNSAVTVKQLRAALDAHVSGTPSSPNDDLAARIRAVHDDPQVSASVKKLTAALLGVNGDAAVAGRPTDAGR